MDKEIMQSIFRAGQIDQEFVNRALAHGGPRTTRSLVTLSAVTSLRVITVESAAGRAKCYLSAQEIAEWRVGIDPLIGQIPTDTERAQYSLGQMSR